MTRRLDRLIVLTVIGIFVLLVCATAGMHAGEPDPNEDGPDPRVIVDEPDPVMTGDVRNNAFHRIVVQQYGLGRQIKAVAEPDADGNLRFFYEPSCALGLPCDLGQAGALVPTLPTDACASDEECEAATDKMCREAGYADGVDSDDVTRTQHVEDGSTTCSGGCAGTNSNTGGSGGVAFITCQPQ
jgi:hypothetical protein